MRQKEGGEIGCPVDARKPRHSPYVGDRSAPRWPRIVVVYFLLNYIPQLPPADHIPLSLNRLDRVLFTSFILANCGHYFLMLQMDLDCRLG
jgi:hypothetical protein